MRDPGTSSLYQLKVLHWRAGISHWILLVLVASESRSLIWSDTFTHHATHTKSE